MPAAANDSSRLALALLAHTAFTSAAQARFDEQGQPNGVDMLGLVPIMAAAIRELKEEIDVLRLNKQF